MEENGIHEARGKVRQARTRLKRIESLLGEIERCDLDDERTTFLLRDRLASLEREIRALSGFSDLPSTLESISSRLKERADEAFRWAKNSVASSLEKKLADHGLGLSGNFPTLTCGLLTLEFSFEGNGSVQIFFGPHVERLKQVPIDPEAMAKAVRDIYEALDGEGFDEEAHLDLLFRAYRNTALLGQRPVGSTVPITAVMIQAAILKQGKRFFRDPTRSSFTDYGRVRFAYDLSRLGARSIRDHQLHLAVASMEQTRRPEDHLWVPRGPRDSRGTHYAGLAFSRMAS